MIVLIRGGGDLASGVALRLHRAGLKVLITELPRPLAIRRLVSFSEAVFTGETVVEGVTSRRVGKADGQETADLLRIMTVFARGQIPVLVDPDALAVQSVHPTVVVDARMRKQVEPLPVERINLLIGLGPGFTPGKNCHAAVETNRGHTLGRVYWDSSPQPDTGSPEVINGISMSRVLRAPVDGTLLARAELGSVLEAGQPIAEINGRILVAGFRGVLRGLLRTGSPVTQNMKIGDLDPRADPALCRMASDKALAVGGGVMEAILARSELRKNFWA